MPPCIWVFPLCGEGTKVSLVYGIETQSYSPTYSDPVVVQTLRLGSNKMSWIGPDE